MSTESTLRQILDCQQAVAQILAEFGKQLAALAAQGEKQMGALDDLKAKLAEAATAEAAEKTEIDGVVALVETFVAQIATLTEALANAGVDPALVAQAQAIVDDISANRAEIAAEVAKVSPPPAP